MKTIYSIHKKSLKQCFNYEYFNQLSTLPIHIVVLELEKEKHYKIMLTIKVIRRSIDQQVIFWCQISSISWILFIDLAEHFFKYPTSQQYCRIVNEELVYSINIYSQLQFILFYNYDYEFLCYYDRIDNNIFTAYISIDFIKCPPGNIISTCGSASIAYPLSNLIQRAKTQYI